MATATTTKGLIQDPTFHTPLVDKEVKFQPLGEASEVKLSVGMVRNFLCSPTTRGNYPDDQEIVKFMMLCSARQLNPWTGDAFLLGYESSRDGPQFNLITGIQALLKRAESNPSFDGYKAGIVLKVGSGTEEREGTIRLDSEVLLGGWAEVHRSDRNYPFTVTLNRRTYDKQRSRWKDDPEGMMRKCALAAALRESFPNLTGGMYLAEEFGADHPPAPDAAPQEDVKANREPPPGQKQNVKAEDLFPEPATTVTSATVVPSFVPPPPPEAAAEEPDAREEPPPPPPAQTPPEPENAAEEPAEPPKPAAWTPSGTPIDTTGLEALEPEELVGEDDRAALNGFGKIKEVDRWQAAMLVAGFQPEAVEYFADIRRDEIREAKFGRGGS